MKYCIFFFLLCNVCLNAQFAPAAGMPGTTAIHKDSSAIVNWASGCTIKRGWQNIDNQSLGEATVGDSSSAIGPADGVTVISLGDRGSAILTFPSPITNLSGPDFCVFENSFDAKFLELAFVEVSSDGINFTRFPATSNTQNTSQIGPFDTTNDAGNLNNLAGKYIGGYGVPFDLQELSGTNGLDVDAITHVRIVDVVGSIQSQYGSPDQNNNLINDPWPTPFASSGFDLEAVGVIHQLPVSVHEKVEMAQAVRIWPIISTDWVHVSMAHGGPACVQIKTTEGKVLKTEVIAGNGRIDLSAYAAGLYILKIQGSNGSVVKKIVKEN